MPATIWGAYQDVWAFDGDLLAADLATLHQLRIAAKWLRYTLEFVREPLEPEATAPHPSGRGPPGSPGRPARPARGRGAGARVRRDHRVQRRRAEGDRAVHRVSRRGRGAEAAGDPVHLAADRGVALPAQPGPGRRAAPTAENSGEPDGRPGTSRPQPVATGWGLSARHRRAIGTAATPAAAGGDGGADDGGLGDRRRTGAHGGADDGGLGDRRRAGTGHGPDDGYLGDWTTDDSSSGAAWTERHVRLLLLRGPCRPRRRR